MPSRGKTRRAVWEVTVNSCWEESLFIVSRLCAEIKTGLVSRSHPRGCAAAAPGIALNCRGPQGLHSGDSTNEETQEANGTAGKIPIGPPHQTLLVEKCSVQQLPQQTKHKNPEPAENLHNSSMS